MLGFGGKDRWAYLRSGERWERTGANKATEAGQRVLVHLSDSKMSRITAAKRSKSFAPAHFNAFIKKERPSWTAQYALPTQDEEIHSVDDTDEVYLFSSPPAFISLFSPSS